MTADFLTRLIERSRGVAPQGQPGQRVEPLIAPLYLAGPNTAPPDDPMDEASVTEPEFRTALFPRREPAPHITPHLTNAVRWSEENISIAPPSQRRESRNKVSTEINSAPALTDETQSAQPNQTSSIEPLPRTTPKSTLPPVSLVNARPGLTATTDQSRRADLKPLTIRPQVARADDSNLRADEAANNNAVPVIRVTIGRIDVRAVTQAVPPARRAAPPAPKLSLEDYLRSRNGEKR